MTRFKIDEMYCNLINKSFDNIIKSKGDDRSMKRKTLISILKFIIRIYN